MKSTDVPKNLRQNWNKVGKTEMKKAFERSVKDEAARTGSIPKDAVKQALSGVGALDGAIKKASKSGDPKDFAAVETAAKNASNVFGYLLATYSHDLNGKFAGALKNYIKLIESTEEMASSMQKANQMVDFAVAEKRNSIRAAMLKMKNIDNAVIAAQKRQDNLLKDIEACTDRKALTGLEKRRLKMMKELELLQHQYAQASVALRDLY